MLHGIAVTIVSKNKPELVSVFQKLFSVKVKPR